MSFFLLRSYIQWRHLVLILCNTSATYIDETSLVHKSIKNGPIDMVFFFYMLEIFSSFQIKCKISSSTNRKCQNRRESMTQLLLLRFILVGPTLQAGEPPQSFDIDNTSLSHNSINNAPIDTVFFSTYCKFSHLFK